MDHSGILLGTSPGVNISHLGAEKRPRDDGRIKESEGGLQEIDRAPRFMS
jgi:hypothetical protein